MKNFRFAWLFVRPTIFLMAGFLLLFAPCGLGEGTVETGSSGPLKDRKDLGPRGDIMIDHMDFSETALTDVIRALADISGLNILAGSRVTGSVSCRFEKVTIKDALESILTTNGFGYVVQGNVVQVRPARELGEDQVETVTRIFVLQYLDALEVEDSLKDIFSSSGQGGGGKTITSNPGANAIIVSDTPARVAEVAELISRLDRRFKQVMIEARLVEVSYDFNRKLGIDWSIYNNTDPTAWNRLDLNNGNSLDAATGRLTQAANWQFGIIHGKHTLDAFLQMEDNVNDVRILANPRILTLHNRMATINIIDERPYVESVVDSGTITQSVKFKETGIVLQVTPRINDEGYISLRVHPSQRIAGPTILLQGSSAFSVDERSAQTDLILADGHTAVIGGLRRQNMEEVAKRVPILGDIPVLGMAFRRTEESIRESELLLFVTPHIVPDQYQMTEGESNRFDLFDREFYRMNKGQTKFEDRDDLAQREAEKAAERSAAAPTETSGTRSDSFGPRYR